MAGRKNKYTVDYFPHYCGNESKTMFILENKFGLKGYAIWYKTLELLGKSEYHFIDLRDDTDMLYLISKLGISEEEFTNIYDLLAKLNAIDLELWNHKIVFSDNFVFNVEDAYVRRKGINVLHKLDLCKHLLIKCEHNVTKESKVNNSKVNKSKINEKKITIFKENNFDINSEEVDIIYKSYPSFYISNGIKKSTGKTKENKKQIEKLLKGKSNEDVKKLFEIIKKYVNECQISNTYLKNFKTLLNNLPDYENETFVELEEKTNNNQSASQNVYDFLQEHNK